MEIDNNNIEQLINRKEKKIIQDSDSKQGSITVGIDSIQTQLLQVYWKLNDHILFFESNQEIDQEDPEVKKRRENQTKMQWRLCQLLTVIVFVLAFQVVSIIALEMNVQVVTENQGKDTINILAAKMEELQQLNSIKPPFKFTFNKEYNQGEGTIEMEFPGSYYYDNFHQLNTDVLGVQNTYQDNGYWQNPTPGFYPLVPQTTWSNSQAYQGYQEYYQESFLVPMIIRDSQDLNSIFFNDITLYNDQMDEIISADFQQEKFKKKGTNSFQGEVTPVYDPDRSTHQYQDFSAIENQIDIVGFQNSVNCVNYNSNQDFQVELDIRQKQDFTNQKEVIPGICNTRCDDMGYYALVYKSDWGVQACNCYYDDPTIPNTSTETSQILCLKQDNKAIVNPVSFYFQTDMKSFIIYTKTSDIFEYEQNFKTLIMPDDPNRSFIKEWKHSDLDQNSLTGSFVRPIHFPKFKFCATDADFLNLKVYDNSIDFQADLIVYPILTDNYNSSVAKQVGLVEFPDNNSHEAVMKNYRVTISNNIDPEIDAKNCSNSCRAQDMFIINDILDQNTKLDCICFSQYDKGTIHNNQLYQFNLDQFESTISSNTNPDKEFNNAQQFYRFESETSEFNYHQGTVDPNDWYSIPKVTAVRNKTVIMPTLDKDMNCIQQWSNNVALTDNSTRRFNSRSFNLHTPVQYTQVNGKTVFVCVPPNDKFKETLTIYPQFEQFPEIDNNTQRDLTYFFGDRTLPQSQEGCPHIAKQIDQFNSSENGSGIGGADADGGGQGDEGSDQLILEDNIHDSKIRSMKSTYTLPRTVSDSHVHFQYLTYFDQTQDSDALIKYFIKEKLDNQYGFQPNGIIMSQQNITMAFCFILVFLSIFDESNESLFCLYTTTRLFIIYSGTAKSCWSVIFQGLIWFLSIAFSIIRIGYTTTKIMIVIILMNWDVTVDELMMNSLALIFVLELDSVTYSWLFDTTKGLGIECQNFLRSFTNIKIYFNIRYYLTAFLWIYFMQIEGIYSQKYPTETVFTLFWLNLWKSIRGEQQDRAVIWFAILQVTSFGSLVEECTIKLQKVTKSKNSSFLWVVGMQVAVLILVQTCMILFIQSDYDFQVYDFKLCMLNNNMNCGNNYMLTSTIWSRNVSLLFFTPIQFVISFGLNIIWSIIYDCIQPLFVTSDKVNTKNTEYKIENSNRIKLDAADLNEGNNLQTYLKENKDLRETQNIWVSHVSFHSNEITKHGIQDEQSDVRKAKQKNSDTEITTEFRNLEVQITNGADIIVDLEYFALFNKITLEQAKTITKFTQSLTEAMKKIIELK